MGAPWWNSERRKDPEERHPVVKWDDYLLGQISKGERNAAGQIGVDVDALVLAHGCLSYDLWVLRNYAGDPRIQWTAFRLGL